MLALLSVYADRPPEPPPLIEPLIVTLAPLPTPEPPLAPTPPAGPPRPSTPAQAPRPAQVRLKPVPPPDVAPLLTQSSPQPEPLATLSDAELIGARSAGSGSEGGGGEGAEGRPCDMVRRLQRALRRDPQIQAAAARAHETAVGQGAILLWNGDWIRSPDQEGKGLAGVRQAIIMEVGFAPEACRNDPVQGLVLISMADGPGAVRLVLGRGRWRWTDLLFAR